ncbi:hypothetical protein T4B_2730 [Trichinella pseudospiralis]|uniref:Uncharacterized protein n=1 Tax=Trichinella pseudospiralis TaxID=6337 RepID=A0A0V1II34_TRIPS|nr:hypothetical protein T4B_2730 [Trichinella pseudospiralis]
MIFIVTTLTSTYQTRSTASIQKTRLGGYLFYPNNELTFQLHILNFLPKMILFQTGQLEEGVVRCWCASLFGLQMKHNPDMTNGHPGKW